MVTLPKDDLDRDNVLTDDGKIPDGQNVFVERADEGVFVVRLCDGGDVPELETTNLVGASPRSVRRR